MKLRMAGVAVILALFAIAFSCNQQVVKAGPHSVTLSWQAPAANSNPACVVTAYNVYRSATPGGEIIPNHLNALPIPSGTTSYTDSTVKSGETWYYEATSFGLGCTTPESVFSNEFKAVIPIDPTQPGAPLAVTGIVN